VRLEQPRRARERVVDPDLAHRRERLRVGHV
jgi:hypothetical protein